MQTKVFRAGGGLFLVGLLFSLVPAAIGVMMVTSLHEGTFKSNGQPVDPNDTGALLGIIAFISIFIIAGLLMCGYAWLARVEVGPDRVRVYNLLGLTTFDELWGDVTGYRRVPGKGNISTQWQISAGDKFAKLPGYSDEPNMQLAMIDHVPKAVVEQERRPSSTVLPPAQGVSGNVRNSTDTYAAIFSVVWYAIVIGSLAIVLQPKTSLQPQSWLDTAMPLVALAFFAVIPIGAFRNAWKRLSSGSITADEDGIRYTDGVKTFGSPWANLRFVELRSVTYNNSNSSFGPANRTVEQLILISGESGIQLDSSLPQFEQVRNMALAYAPASALVFAND